MLRWPTNGDFGFGNQSALGGLCFSKLKGTPHTLRCFIEQWMVEMSSIHTQKRKEADELKRNEEKLKKQKTKKKQEPMQRFLNCNLVIESLFILVSRPLNCYILKKVAQKNCNCSRLKVAKDKKCQV